MAAQLRFARLAELGDGLDLDEQLVLDDDVDSEVNDDGAVVLYDESVLLLDAQV